MPIIALFAGASIANIVVRALLGIGVGLVTYTGLNVVLGMATDAIKQNMTGLPAAAMQILGLGGIDFAINMILSAYAVRIALVASKKLRLK